MIKIILLVLVAEIFTAVGQIMLKKSTNTIEANNPSYNLMDINGHTRLLRDVFATPSLWFGFLAMAIGLVVWLVALAEGELSVVFSIGSLQYIIILFAAHFFLNEKIDRMKLLGTFLVVLGIVLIAFS